MKKQESGKDLTETSNKVELRINSVRIKYARHALHPTPYPILPTAHSGRSKLLVLDC